ncbi:MAG: DAK2 domain-containing protein [Acholeplasmataceae bacterium]
MSNKKISGDLFKKMVTNGAIHLKNNHKEVDHLNVFPVPDGDTGTNMQMTMMAGVTEVNSINSNSIVDVSKILSRGLLMGARGNSGVILSQFFRGVYSEISKINNGSVTVKEFIQALVGGYEMAYRAVIDPVEGTILTVVRESAEKVLREQHNLKNIEDVLRVYLEQAKDTLIKTPELLPVLKEAGVVDSGGAGFIKIIEGMLMAIQGQILIEQDVDFISESPKIDTEYIGAHNLGDVDIKYGYCTEFIVDLFSWENFDPNDVREPLSQMGDSLVVVNDENLLKVHVHTNQPGVALTLAQKFGELKTIKIDNMRIQHTNITGQDHMHHHAEELSAEENKAKVKYGIIAVAQGAGIKETFKELGVDYVIDGGQTMNPPTEDFIKAIKKVNAENIIILPNNSNIVLTAEQAAKLVEDEENVAVIKTKSVAQGYSSLISFDPTATLSENALMMKDSLEEMKYGEVTYAVRDTEMFGVKVKNGDFIGIFESQIVVSSKERLEVINSLLKDMIDDETEIVTVFYGKDVEENELELVSNNISLISEDIEVEFVNGGQEVYSYIIAVE